MKNYLLCCLWLISGLIAADYESMPAKAVLFPFREAILAGRLDGVLANYNFKVGERFKENDELVRLDDAERVNQLKRASAVFAETELSMKFAKRSYDEAKNLFAKDMSSELDVKRKEFEFQTAQVRMQIAKTDMEDAALKLKFCLIKAPFAGVIARVLTREFETVRAGQQLMLLIDDNHLLATLNLSSHQLPNLRLGQKAKIKITETNATIAGEIYEIASIVDHRSQTVEIKVMLANTEHKLSAGMSGVLVEIEK